MDHTWEVRNPDGAMLGVEWARGVCEARDAVLAHTLPATVDVVVRDEAGGVVASGEGLTSDRPTPMSRLRISGTSVTREAVWPTDEDLGAAVLLPGGEVGLLKSWWNADDESAWRWQLELSNSR